MRIYIKEKFLNYERIVQVRGLFNRIKNFEYKLKLLKSLHQKEFIKSYFIGTAIEFDNYIKQTNQNKLFWYAL